jgi:hypothetical protein
MAGLLAAAEPLPVRAVFGLSELPAALAAARAPGPGRILLALDR